MKKLLLVPVLMLGFAINATESAKAEDLDKKCSTGQHASLKEYNKSGKIVCKAGTGHKTHGTAKGHK